MNQRNFTGRIFSMVGLTLATTAVLAQPYPSKPVRYVAPATGATELVARLVAQGLTDVLGQQVFVDVRTGAGGNIGAEIAARAPADGYTLLQIAQGHTVNVSLYKKLPYDLVRDFSPVTKLDVSPLLLVVHPSLPVKSVRELVKLAKSKPRALEYASAGVGTSTYLAAELFKIIAGVDLLEVPYRGGGAALTAAVAGEAPVFFVATATSLPFVRDGRLRMLAVCSEKRLPFLPDSPTVAESGYPGYEASNWHGLAVPANTPKEIVATLRAAAVAALKRPEVSKRMLELGLTPVGDQPDEFAVFMRAEIEKWRKVVRQKGLALD